MYLKYLNEIFKTNILKIKIKNLSFAFYSSIKIIIKNLNHDVYFDI